VARPRMTKRIALFYPLRLGNAQDFLRGIFRYARPDRPWEFSLTHGWNADRLLAWRPDGIIGHVLTADAALTFERVSVPVVETAFDFEDLPVPRVGLDDRAIGTMAAEHFLDHGFFRFVYIGEPHRAYSQRRWEGFRSRLRAAPYRAADATGVIGSHWQEGLPPVSAQARKWIQSLSGPIAIFAAHDALGLELLEAARSVGAKVPEDLAVLAVNNIDWICDLAHPPLSSIRTAAETAGFEAARLLDHLMAGGPPPASRIEFPPLGVATRRSTDVYAVTEASLAAALQFIRDHSQQNIGVHEVAEAACVSRSTLERRFRALLGRSPLQEIHRVRIERARQALIEHDWPMSRVARHAGFRDERHLTERFRAHCGEPPSSFRARFRCG